MAGPMRYNLKGIPSFKKALSREINGLKFKPGPIAKGPFDSISYEPLKAAGWEDYIKKRPRTYESIVSGDTESSQDSDESSYNLGDSDEYEDSGYMSDKENQDPHIKGPKPTLPTLPIKIINKLFIILDDPGSALSLALTCKRFYIIHFRKNGPMLPSRLFWWGTYSFVYLRDWMGPEYDFDYVTARFLRREKSEAMEDATTEDENSEDEGMDTQTTEDEIVVDDEYYLSSKSKSLFEEIGIEVFEDAATGDETEDEIIPDEAIEEKIAGLKRFYDYSSDDDSTTEAGEI